jgi:hypothetical protein
MDLKSFIVQALVAYPVRLFSAFIMPISYNRTDKIYGGPNCLTFSSIDDVDIRVNYYHFDALMGDFLAQGTSCCPE